MSTVEPYFDGEKWWYCKATWRHAQQTKERAAGKLRKGQLEAEVKRLRLLGADEAWIERVTALEAEEGARWPSPLPRRRRRESRPNR